MKKIESKLKVARAEISFDSQLTVFCMKCYTDILPRKLQQKYELMNRCERDTERRIM